ncbi:MAG: 16S rRNA (uracil(1498)-N(3))-methyltransferase [Desulfobacteraceae bacterium]|nr:16S rRNA (uracil(1498)-N(3))-methyltransferase [Desulfobacteraceae bacterium]
MHQFFIEPEAVRGDTVLITGAEAHHLRTVLRLAAGDRVRLFDGTGRILEAVVTRVSKGETETRIVACTTAEPPPVQVHIGQAQLKGKKMDLLVQKANELGIQTLMPFVSARCEVRTGNPERQERWERIVFESCKQCGRAVPMACPPETDFAGMLAAGCEFDLKLIFWEEERQRSLGPLLAPMAPVHTAMALIGPEGGFTEEEVTQATAAGFLPVSIGRRILRAETASLAAMAILQHRFGNLD